MNENPKPYQAIIKGKRCKIAWDENHDNILLVDGVPHEVGVMEGSLDVLRKQRLLSISELKFGGSTGRATKGWWLVDGKHPGQWIIEASGDSRRLTYQNLDQVLSKNERPAKFTKNRPPLPTVTELRKSAVAVAFVKENRHPFDDGKSILLPIFLSRFKPMNNIPYPAEINGERVRVQGWDEQENLLLANGRCFEFEPIHRPDFKLSTRTLVSVSRLVWENGVWLLDGAGLQEFINEEMQKAEANRNPKYAALDSFLKCEFPPGNPWMAGLSARLSKSVAGYSPDSVAEMLARGENPWTAGLSDDTLNKSKSKPISASLIRAVAWFEDVENPMLLTSFRLLPTNANPEKLVQELTKAIESNAEQKGKATLHKANELASLNLEQALSKWFGFNPPGMKIGTQARIEKAVRMYMTDKDKRSLGKIAKEFGVTPKTVSTWFASFTEQTGFKVVRHQRHESVADHLEADLKQATGNFGKKTPTRGLR